MTPDEIRNLKPGPELDRAVAIALDYPTHGEEGGRIYQRGPEGTELLPAYSSTWAGLGRLVESMERRGWRVGLEQLEEGPWMAGFAPGPDGAFVTCGYGERGSVVCKAALLALAAEKGQRL